ncbi:M3 family metallopeptidase [Novosphingobium sp.]|uniref:M3 family metallopeptidase n=1 Tax=Novosphingobium sp. TaxID=1874826 RepID=UPI0028A85EB8|nr:M3 family metallopeptidase [Novosphingobium sp.]
MQTSQDFEAAQELLLDAFELPPFDSLEPSAIIPALKLAISRHRTVRMRVLEGRPTRFDQAWIPLERAETAINALWSAVSHLREVADTAELRAAFVEGQSLLVDYMVETNQDPDLFAIFEDLAKATTFLSLPSVDRVAVERTLRDRRLAGVTLSDEQRMRFREISLRLSALSTAFGSAVLDATQAWYEHVTDERALTGIAEADKASFAAAARLRGLDGWCITLQQPSVSAVMSFCENRELRARLYRASGTRASDQGPNAGEYDNSARIAEILALRRELAALLGFATPAHWSLATKMVDAPGDVTVFLRDLAAHVRPAAERDMETLRTFAREHLDLATLEPWDIAFASERLRRNAHAIDEQEIRSYFPIERVLAGWQNLLTDLFALSMKTRDGVALWHEQAQYLDIFDADGALIAGIYLDLHARPGKRGGAWMSSARPRICDEGRGNIPVAYLTCNFAPLTAGAPALLSHWDIQTLLHETGHCLHQILTQVDRPNIGGIRGFEWDAVELPSQVMEDFAWDREIVASMSGHHETGTPLPDEMFDRLLNARHFQSGMTLARQLELGLFDMQLHLATHPVDPMEVLEGVRDDVSVSRPPAWHRFPHAFTHIFAGGYAAGYYSYLWAEVLAAHAFEAFLRNGPVDRQTGERFRAEILARGASRPAAESFRAFMGCDPDPSALLRRRGLAARYISQYASER